MPGNSFGNIFKITTWGESHGKALGVVIDGCPAGIKISEKDIQIELDRRRPGQNKFTTQRKEPDKVEILSGVFNGQTTGTPISLIIKNADAISKSYEAFKDIYRPGHADLTYDEKYGIRDHRGGGRSSARETAMRVAAGAIAKKYLNEKLNIKITGYLSQIGSITISNFDSTQINRNPFFCPDPKILTEIEDLIDQLRKDGDSVGAKIEVSVSNMPIGLGEPVFDKLEADLAKGLMSINAVKGFEIGKGFDLIHSKGSESRDEMTSEGYLSNNSGGISGGISTGQEIKLSIALKPTSSINKEGQTIDLEGKSKKIQVKGRHDPCVGVRATPIAEAMTALVIMDHFLRNRAQNADVVTEIPDIS